MDIKVENLQKKLKIRPKTLQRIIHRILKKQNVKTASLSVCFVSAQKIRALNIQYLKRYHTTDVLAFPLSEKQGELVGDIMISTDAIKQNARTFGTDIDYEGVLYIVHGILHLLGYDDHKPADVRKMRAREEVLMQFLKKDIAKTFSL